MSELAPIEVDERVTRLVWKGIGVKSARQIADEAGVSPDVVLRVKKELLDGVDELTIQERRVKVMAELQDLSTKARDRYETADDEFAAGLLNSSVAALKALLVELARLEKADTSKVDALNQLRIRELLSLISAVVEAGVREVAEEHGLDEDDLFAVFNKHLVLEAEKRDMA